MNFLHEDKCQSFCKLISLFLVAIPGHAQITILQNLCNIWIKKGESDEVDFFARRYTAIFSTSRCYQFWWARLVMPKVLKIRSLQNVLNISRKNWEMKLIFCMLINNVFILQGDTIFFDGFGQTCPMYPGKFAISLNISRKKLEPLIFGIHIDLLAMGIIKDYYKWSILLEKWS